MRYHLFLGLILSALALRAQPVTQVLPQPDCQFFFTFTAAGQFLPANGAATSDNRQQGCTSWNMSYVSSGFSAVSVTLQSAANNAGAPSTFGTGFPVQQAIVAGSNPGTNTTGGYLWVQGTNAWVRVTLASATGSGVVNGAVFGWRIPNAASQGGGAVCLTGDVTAGSGSGCLTATVVGLESVPFCTGYTPSNGQFVQYTTGSSPNPCYTAASAAAGGGLVGPLEEHTASSSSSLDFTTCFSSTYDDYQIRVVSIVPSASGNNFTLQVRTGSGFDTGANYSWARLSFDSSSNANAGAGSTTSILLAPVVDTAGVSETIDFSNPGSVVANKMIRALATSIASSDLIGTTVAAVYTPSTAVTGFRVQMSAGTLVSGTVRCYGYAK